MSPAEVAEAPAVVASGDRVPRGPRAFGFVASPLLGLLAIGAARFLHERAAILGAAIWGLALLGSFRGWGRAANRVLGGWRSELALDATVGLALSIFFGGLLGSVRLVSVATLVVWTAGGYIVDAILRVRRPSTSDRGGPRIPKNVQSHVIWGLAIAVLGAMMALQYVDSITLPEWSVWDDNMAYRGYVREFLDIGTLDDPFSFRRVGAYGGQSYIQAMVLALTDRDRLHMFDNGLCPVILFFLVLGYRGSAKVARRAGVFLALVLLVTLPYTPHNLSSELSGVVFLFALFRLFDEAIEWGGPSRSRAIVVGLLCGAISTLRQNYMFAAFLIVLIGYGALARKQETRRAWIQDALVAFAATGAALVPWMIVSLRATGTVLYPVMRGYVQEGFGYSGVVTLSEEARWTFVNMFTVTPVRTTGIFFLAAFLLPATRKTRALHVLLLVTMGTFFLMMHFFRGFNDADSIARYYFFVVVTLALAVTLKALGSAEGRASGSSFQAFAAGGLVVVAVALQLQSIKDDLVPRTQNRISALAHLWDPGPGIWPTPTASLYERLQATVPPQERLLVMLDHTYLLDAKRNHIYHYDHPGVMGPRPGVPVHQGPEAWATYMLSQGIRYVAFQVGPSSPEYNVPLWTARLNAPVDPSGRGNFYRVQATYDLDAFATLTELASTRKNLFKEGDVHVLDLKTLN